MRSKFKAPPATFAASKVIVQRLLPSGAWLASMEVSISEYAEELLLTETIREPYSVPSDVPTSLTVTSPSYWPLM